MPAQNRDILILQCRNFGDAVITTGLVEALGRSLPDINISVFTRSEYRPLFADNPYVSAIYTATFPMGTLKRLSFKAMVELASQIWRLRRCRFGSVVHVCGDLRENLIGWLIAPRGLVGPKWAEGNQFLETIRDGLGFLRTRSVAIKADNPNIYDAQQQVAMALGATVEAHPKLYIYGKAARHNAGSNTIGLHVSASQETKMWPVAAWRALIVRLRQRGVPVKIFGAPSERSSLLSDYADLLGPDVTVSTGNLTEFFMELAGIRALVCLDSLSVHAAYAIGVPTLMLIGSTMVDVYRPPPSEFINGGIGLACSPCMNKPTCMHSAQPFQCMREIDPETVLKRLDLMGALASKTQTADEPPHKAMSGDFSTLG